MDMRSLIYTFIKQYFIIVAGTVIATAVSCAILIPTAVITIDFLWGILFFCVLADLPVFVYFSKKELTRQQWNVRTILHTILLEVVLLLAGRKLGMYHGIFHGIIFAVIVLFVDLFVRAMTYTKDWKTADDINRKIQERRNEQNISSYTELTNHETYGKM